MNSKEYPEINKLGLHIFHADKATLPTNWVCSAEELEKLLREATTVYSKYFGPSETHSWNDNKNTIFSTREATHTAKLIGIQPITCELKMAEFTTTFTAQNIEGKNPNMASFIGKTVRVIIEVVE